MAGDPLWYYKVLGLHCDGTNGSTTFTDVKGNTVTANGNAQISTAQYPALTGKTASALFDGAGDYLSIPDSADWDFGSGDFTIRFLCRPTSTSVEQEIIAQRKTADSDNFWFVRRTSAEKIRVYAKAGGSIITDVLSTGTLTVDSWQLVEIVRTSGSVKISIAGTFGTAVTTDGSGSWPNVAHVVYVGVGDDTFSAGNFYNGYLSEIEIYKGVALHTSNFTPATAPFADEYVSISGTTKDSSGSFASRLVRVYRRDTGSLVGEVVSNESTGTYKVIAANSGTTTPLKHFAVCYDPSIFTLYRVLGLHCDGTNGSTTFTDVCGKTVTANGNAQISTAQYANLTGNSSSGYFDGTGDYLNATLTGGIGSGDMTIDFWVRESTFSGDRNYLAINNGAVVNVLIGNENTGSGDLRFVVRNDSGTTNIDLSSAGATLSLNTWAYVRAVVSGSTAYLFLNGTLVNSGTLDGTRSGSGTDLQVARLSSGMPRYFTGYLDDLRITKGIARSTANFTPPTDPFTDSTTATENALIYDDLTPT